MRARLSRAFAAIGLVLLGALGTVAVGAQSGSGTAPGDGGEEVAVRELVERIIAADNRGDLEEVLALYSEAAVLLPPGEPPVEGRAAIERRYRAIFDSTHLALRSKVESVRLADGWAVARGRISGRVVSKADGSSREVDDKFVMLVERRATGTWVIAELMWSPDST